MELGGEMQLGDVDGPGIGHRDPQRPAGAVERRHPGKRPEGPGVRGEPGDLVADVAGPLDSVVFRDQARRADEEVDERELVGHRGEPVKLHEGPRERPRVLPLPLQEHPVVGHEDVVEDGERFGHPVPARERVVEHGGGVVAVGADHRPVRPLAVQQAVRSGGKLHAEASHQEVLGLHEEGVAGAQLHIAEPHAAR